MNIQKEILERNVLDARNALEEAERALDAFIEAPENNRFDTLDDAHALEEVLRDRAYEDCQGAYNCGNEYYEQEFYVGDKLYVASANVEYNRHDKTYYYIEEFDFKIEEAK